MLLLADAEEAAERHHGVDRLAADLVDHDVVDRPELVAVHVVDAGAVDLLGSDQRAAGDLGDVSHRWGPPGMLLPPTNVQRRARVAQRPDAPIRRRGQTRITAQPRWR